MNKAGTLAEVATALNAGHPAGGKLPALVFVTDDDRVADPAAALARLPKGCAVLFRHYAHPDRAGLAARVVERAHDQGRIVLLAGDLALAEAVNADGVHMPEHMLRTLTKPIEFEGVTTAAAHSLEALNLAAEKGFDAAFLSPVFATTSHPGAEGLGAAGFAKMVKATALPVYALGGITNETAPELLGSGAVGIAAIGGLSSPDARI